MSNVSSTNGYAISVVIITRHRPKPIADCLRSLEPFRPRGLEVIVVDNSDDELTKQVVAEQFPWAVYQRVPHAKNFQTATRNRGLQLARAPIVAYVDDDATVEPTWFDACLDGYREPDVGSVGGRVMDPEVEGNDYFRDAPICKMLPNGRLTDNLECDPGKIVEVDHLRGCNYSLKKEVALAAGGFDEHLMGYGFEDLDMLLRVHKLGKRILFHPKMEVYHHLVPREKISRWDKGFAGRVQHCRNLIYSYAKTVPKIACRYFLGGDTGWLGLLRRPSMRGLLYVVSGYVGKSSGLWRWLIWFVKYR